MFRTIFKLTTVAVLIIALGTIEACVRQPRPDDAGDYAFARQVIPKLYGRKAKGYAEVKLVGDLSGLLGREKTLRALMAQPEFAEHWSEVLVDRMRINRTEPKSQQSCFPETLTANATNLGLAAWIRDHYASATAPAMCSGGSCGNFTMSDVLRSSITLDDLSPVFRAYLFPLVNKPPTGAEIEESNKRSDLFKNFETVYLGRSNTCLACHNSAWSMSGPQSYWNRTHPILGLPELAVYGANIGRLPREVESMMRTDAASGAHRPWGLSTSCGMYSTTVSDDGELAPSETAFLAGSHARRGTVFDIDRHLHDGINKIAADGIQRFTSAQTTASCSVCGTCTGSVEPSLDAAQIARETAAGAILGSTRCIGCHAGNAGGLMMTASDWKSQLIRTASNSSTLSRVKPGDATNSYLMQKLLACSGGGCPMDANLIANNTNRMPYNGPYLSVTEIATIETWINGMPTESGCSTCQASRTQGMCDGVHRELDPDEALALLVGANTVNTVWTEVMGYPLSIDNGFPRNADQKGVLWNLTEYTFLNNHWSLRELLVSILSFRFYNRLPPSESTGTTGYEITMLFDPWVEGDPRIPPQALDGWTPGDPEPTPDSSYSPAAHPERHKNAMTEAVHRYSANTLMNSVARSLVWPKPKRFPDNSYPSATLAGSIGQFIKDAEPGFRGVDMQGLLTWEANVGQCIKPAGIGTDWIDTLLAAHTTFDTANPADPITVRDFVQTMRDWLINDSELRSSAATGTTDAESQLIANLFGVSALNVPVSSVTDLPTKARRYCGVLLKSPQFMLAGIAPTELGNKPRLQVCNPGEDCSYQAMCTALHPALSTSRYQVLCRTESVSILPHIKVPSLTEIFPKKWLWGIEKACFSAGCQVIERPPLRNPKELSTRIIPQIDAVPMDLPHKLLDGAALAIGWAGLPAASVDGVTLLRGDKRQPLAVQDILEDGDLLVFAPKASMTVGKDTLDVPSVSFTHLAKEREGMQGVAETAPLIVYVVGKTRLQLPASGSYATRLPMSLIKQINSNAEWLLHGSAGQLRGPVGPRARQDTPESQQFWKKQREQLQNGKEVPVGHGKQ